MTEPLETEKPAKEGSSNWFWRIALFFAALATASWAGLALFLAVPEAARCLGDWRIWTAFGLLGSGQSNSECMELNEFGDFLAGAFAPLAFLWLVIAVILQGRELAKQREELAITRGVAVQQRAEMEQTADALLDQSKTMEKTALLNTQQQARADLYTLVDLIRPVFTRLVNMSGRTIGPNRSDHSFMIEFSELAVTTLSKKVDIFLDAEGDHSAARFIESLEPLAPLEDLLKELPERLSRFDHVLYERYHLYGLQAEFERMNRAFEVSPDGI